MTAVEIDARIADLAKRARLDAWNAFVEELQVPSELYPALMTNRPELIKLAPARALTAEQVGDLYRLIGGLLETNQALREHAAQVAALAQDFVAAFNGLFTTARKLRYFANFKHEDAAAAGEEDL